MKGFIHNIKRADRILAAGFLLIVLTTVTNVQTGELRRINIEQIPPPDQGIPVFRDHPDKAALIIYSSLTNLTFDSNMGGIVDHYSEPALGSYILIIEPFTQIMQVNAPGFMTGRFRVAAPQARDVLYYEIEPEERTPDLIPLVFNVEPADARLFVDDQITETNRTVQLPPGPKQIRLEREGFRVLEDVITVSMDNVMFNYQMDEIDIVPVRIASNVLGARVNIDGMDRGEIDNRGGLGLFLFPGSYALSVTANGHITESKTIEVLETGNNSFSAEVQRNIGTLHLALTPPDASIAINREDYSGQSEIELVPGRYRLEVRKEGYAPFAESLELALNDTVSRNITLEAYTGSLQYSVVPSDARVRLLDASGSQVQNWEGLNLLRDLKVGRYKLEASAPGYQTSEEYIQVSKDETLQYRVELIEGATFDNDTQTVVVDIRNPATGRVWMDRNLGASRVATTSTDSQSYGYLYQWGRASDGHQKRTSPTTNTLSSSDQPGHGSFILASNSPYDWRNPQNDNLWQGVNGANNPCPAGYRLPTEAEWNVERNSWVSKSASGAFRSPLKLPLAGSRGYSNGSLFRVGYGAYYWSSNVSGNYARYLYFSSSPSAIRSYFRTNGYSVRCLKN